MIIMILKLKVIKSLLADVFDNFKNMCLKIHELHTDLFLIVSKLAWKAALKKRKEE